MVAGKTAVTSDSNDEAGNGGLADKNGTVQSATASLDTTNKRLQMTIPALGRYNTNSKLYAAFSAIASLIGLTAAKLVGGNTVLGVAGTALNDATIDNANDLLSGVVAYGKNGVKYTGNVAIQSVLSFSAAPYSSTQIVFTWKNPAKGPFSGVIIVGKTGSYPTSISDGTRWYKGSGSNTTASGTSTATVSGFTAGTTYYFRCFSYAIKNSAEWVHGTSYTATATVAKGTQTFKSSGTFTVPAGVRSIDIFCVGGGGSGGRGGTSNSGSGQINGGGGGGGYTATKLGYAVTPGSTFTVTVGAGGARPSSTGDGNAGGATSFGSVLTANGGSAGGISKGGNGGSGGGASISYQGSSLMGGDGGSNGGNGAYAHNSSGSTTYGTIGKGQGTTTRAFGESSNTLYAGGGGGTHTNLASSTSSLSGAGGAGGGGAGGYIYYTDEGDWEDSVAVGAVDGTANTGGGGGGGKNVWSSVDTGSTNYYAGAGGSGICIVRWGY